jgi:CrcB protein
MKNVLFVFIGGGVGSVCRYLLSSWIPFKSGIPYATLSANVVGSFLIGLFMAYFAKQENASQESLMLMLTVGLCGGFTTFSTFSRESFLFIYQHQWSMFVLYASISLILCIISVAAGFLLLK